MINNFGSGSTMNRPQLKTIHLKHKLTDSENYEYLIQFKKKFDYVQELSQILDIESKKN